MAKRSGELIKYSQQGKLIVATFSVTIMNILKFYRTIEEQARQLIRLPIYPLLLAVYPILFIYTHNISELSIGVIYVPILFSLAIVSLAMLLMQMLLRNWSKTSLLTFMALIVFYFYQPLVLQMPHSLLEINGIELTRGKIMLPLVALVTLMLAYSVLKAKNSKLTNFSMPLNVMLLLLMSFSIFQIGQVEISRAINRNLADKATSLSDANAASDFKPDIYYFIFDRYASEPTLSNFYRFDNSPFLNELAAEGFYIANESYTNYPSTEISIASSLSMDYHQSNEEAGREQDFTTDIYPKVRDAQIVKELKELGYTYYQVASHYNVTQFSNVADKVYIPRSESAWHLDEFSIQVLQTTLVNVVGKDILHQVVNLDHFESFLNAHTYQQEVLPRIIQQSGPKMVFTHVLLPHDPYVVNKDCQPIEPTLRTHGTDLPAYLDQLQCANKLILGWVDAIKKESGDKALIIVQADEGPYPLVNKLPQQKNFSTASVEAIKERAGILNAYYFPDKDYSQLYSTITPVNTFRTVLRQYFGYDIENLEDKVYVFPSQQRYFDFIDVSRQLELPTDTRSSQ